MKRSIFLSVLVLTTSLVYSQSATSNLSLIPQPVSMVQEKGSFTLPNNLVIVHIPQEGFRRIATQLSQKLKTATNNVTTKEAVSAEPKSIFLTLSADSSIHKEGYRLKITADGVVLTARQPAGIFYGVQTLLQLLPP